MVAIQPLRNESDANAINLHGTMCHGRVTVMSRLVSRKLTLSLYLILYLLVV